MTAMTGDLLSKRGLRLSRVILRRQMALRGLSGVDLAAEAHISAPTMTAALAGRNLSPQTVRSIASALARIPSIVSEDLLESA